MKDKFSEAIETYNKIAKIYSEYNKNRIMQYQLTKFSSILPGKKILDAGCGPGRDSEYFIGDGFEVTGVDVSKELLKIARKNVSDAKFKLMDFRKLTFKDNSFDGIWSMASLVHINRTEIPSVLKEFSRVLVSKGVLYISVREGEGDKEIRQEKYDNEPRHFFYFGEEEFRKYLKDAGFKIIEIEISELESGKNWLEIYAKKVE